MVGRQFWTLTIKMSFDYILNTMIQHLKFIVVTFTFNPISMNTKNAVSLFLMTSLI